MNLSTRRLNVAELSAWAASEARAAWGGRVVDRFGNYGLSGILSVEIVEDEGRIVDFLLSCRVMGRRVEETRLHVAVNGARDLGARRVTALYVETPKNLPCLQFLERSPLQRVGDLFVCDEGTALDAPSQIHFNVDTADD